MFAAWLFNSIEIMLYQRWNDIETMWKVEKTVKSTLFQRQTLALYFDTDTDFVQYCYFWCRISFHFERRIKLRWFTRVKQRSSDIEMLTGKGIEISGQRHFVKKLFS